MAHGEKAESRERPRKVQDSALPEKSRKSRVLHGSKQGNCIAQFPARQSPCLHLRGRLSPKTPVFPSYRTIDDTISG